MVIVVRAGISLSRVGLARAGLGLLALLRLAALLLDAGLRLRRPRLPLLLLDAGLLLRGSRLTLLDPGLRLHPHLPVLALVADLRLGCRRSALNLGLRPILPLLHPSLLLLIALVAHRLLDAGRLAPRL